MRDVKPFYYWVVDVWHTYILTCHTLVTKGEMLSQGRAILHYVVAHRDAGSS
jgi:hypothetical protein